MGNITHYPDQELAIYPVDDLSKMLTACGFKNICAYGSREYIYPADLSPVQTDSAFIQVTCRK